MGEWRRCLISIFQLRGLLPKWRFGPVVVFFGMGQPHVRHVSRLVPRLWQRWRKPHWRRGEPFVGLGGVSKRHVAV